MRLHEPQNSTPPSSPSSPRSEWAGSRTSVMIARIVGILCVAVGFVLGVQGLSDPDSVMLPTALGMIVAGLLAQVFALVRTCFVAIQGKR